jgi:hypothetical protein
MINVQIMVPDTRDLYLFKEVELKRVAKKINVREINIWEVYYSGRSNIWKPYLLYVAFYNIISIFSIGDKSMQYCNILVLIS